MKFFPNVEVIRPPYEHVLAGMRLCQTNIRMWPDQMKIGNRISDKDKNNTNSMAEFFQMKNRVGFRALFASLLNQE